MEKFNIAELLKDCPKGMELDCTTWENVTFEKIVGDAIYIKRNSKVPSFDKIVVLNKYGCTTTYQDEKCRIFPKGKTTWEGFQRPFEDGDILATNNGRYIAIVKKNGGKYYCCCHTNGLCLVIDDSGWFDRLATEEEKAKLFQTIKANGYRWNAETKTLEKLPKFKVGDRVKHISAYTPGIVVKVADKGYYIDYPKGEGVCYINFALEKDYELAPNKFDITTLKAFDKVLVRNTNTEYWRISLFGAIVHDDRRYFMCLANSGFYQCVPYEHNEHLLGTSIDCDDFYKTWEK